MDIKMQETHREIRKVVETFYAKRLHCDPSVLHRRATTVTTIRQTDRPDQPFLALDNEIAQVFSVTEALRKTLEETLFWCTHWTREKVDLHDYVFFEETLWPRLRHSFPRHQWFKGLLLYCREDGFKPCSSRFRVTSMCAAERGQRSCWAAAENVYYVRVKSTEPDFHGKMRRIAGPVSFASIRPHGEDAQVVSMEISTRPEFRRQGMARAVLAHATRVVLDSGRIPLFGVSYDNVGSIITARSVGYRQYGKILGYRA